MPTARSRAPTRAAATAPPAVDPSPDGVADVSTHFSVDGYRIEDSIGYLMKLAFAGLRRNLDRHMSEHALTGVQMLPLLLIACGECRTAAELARINETDAGATTRLLDRLQAKGLLLRQRNAADRRVVHLQLTPAGLALAARIPQAISKSLDHSLRGFSPAETDTLRALLRRVIANVESSP